MPYFRNTEQNVDLELSRGSNDNIILVQEQDPFSVAPVLAMALRQHGLVPGGNLIILKHKQNPFMLNGGHFPPRLVSFGAERGFEPIQIP